MKNNLNQLENTFVDYSSKEPTDLNINSLIEDNNDTIHGISTSNDLILISESSNEHVTFKNMLKRKYDSLKAVNKWWVEGDLSSVMNTLRIMKDKIIMNDFFNFAFMKNDINKFPLNNEILHMILPLTLKLTSEKYDTYIKTGLGTSNQLLNLYMTNNLNKNDKGNKTLELFNEIRKLPIIEKILSNQQRFNGEIFLITRSYVTMLEKLNS